MPSKNEVKDRLKKNVTLIWDEYPIATVAMTAAGFVLGLIVMAWMS